MGRSIENGTPEILRAVLLALLLRWGDCGRYVRSTEDAPAPEYLKREMEI